MPAISAIPPVAEQAHNIKPTNTANKPDFHCRSGEYRILRVLGEGTYATVHEAIHNTTGVHYAVKIFDKRGIVSGGKNRVQMLLSEISVLKRLRHENIVKLVDVFECPKEIWLVLELATGGELYDQICARGSFCEHDAAILIRTVLDAVKYLHDNQIVHRDLKPENLLFRSKDENSPLLVADFGLARVLNKQKSILQTMCGTVGYIAPEVITGKGHGKPVDIWSVGVITYFLLSGYTPFDREDQNEEYQAVVAGNYKFEPAEYWEHITDEAIDFIRYLLNTNPVNRPTADEALAHPWLNPPEIPDSAKHNILPSIEPGLRRLGVAKQRWKKAATKIQALRGFSHSSFSSGRHSSGYDSESSDGRRHSSVVDAEE